MYFRARAMLGYCLLAAVCLLLGAAPRALAVEPLPPIDLATLSANAELTALMAVRQGGPARNLTPQQALVASHWQRGGGARDLLAEPREQSTVWLRGLVTNTSVEPLTRWLQLSPWRLNQVNAWFLAPDTQRVLAQAQTGLNVPVAERTVESSRALVPVTLAPGESQELLLKITSDSRPFLTISSWDPIDFTAAKVTRYQTHAILLTAVLTLLAVLLLQGNRQYALIGAWMLATFVLEAEKEGYISFVLLSGLADYASNIRFSAWILHKALFLIVSVYLLRLHQRRIWRWLPAAVLVIAGVFSTLTFFLNGVDIRNLGIAIDFAFSGTWLLLLPGALQQKNRWHWAILLLVSFYWLTTGYMLLSYTFAFHYTAAFASSRVVIEIAVVLGLLCVYALQKRGHERWLERQVRDYEKAQRAQLEQAVATRTHELQLAVHEESRANAAKTDFLARITHDLRSPLTSILGYTQLLGAEHGRTGEISRTVHASAAHMLNLVNRLIGYARGAGEGEVRLVDLYLFTFLESVGQEAKVTSHKGGNAFQLVMEPNLPPVVRCDETYLRQILLNLLDNAAKHTVGGTIELHVGHSKGAREDSVHLVFCVTDNGCGVPAELQERLWDAFYQPPGQHEGLGLGLSIVQQLTRELGGELTLESEPDQGTRVSLELPMTLGREDDAKAAITHMPHHVLPHFDASGLDAWVIEDSAAIREFLHTELSGLGFETRLFASAEAFVNVAKTAQRPPDLVITDHHLPGASGDAVLETSRHRWPDVPVILLSATQKTLVSAPQNTGYRYTDSLTKPVNLVTLRRTLAGACRRELSAQPSPQPISEPVAPEKAAVALDAEERRQLAHFLTLGAVTDLLEWCQALAEKDPDRQELAATLSHLAEHGRFDTLAGFLQKS